MADTNNVYTKKLVIETNDGQVTLEAGEARALQRMLDDNPRFFKVSAEEGGITTYYDINSAACGFCKVAALTPGESKTGKDIPCEDGLPDCE